MMIRGPKATSPPANTSGREVAIVCGSVCSVPRGVTFRLSSGLNPGKVRRLADGQDDRIAIHRLLAAFDELRIEPAVLVEDAAAPDQFDAGDLAVLPEDAFRAEARVEPDAFLFRLLDLLARGRDFVEVLQAIHVDLGHALADGFARHVQGEAHLVGRFRLARGQLLQRRRGLVQRHAQFRLAHPRKLFRLAHDRARRVEGDVAAADDDDFAPERHAVTQD